MKEHLYRVYGLDDDEFRIFEECERRNRSGNYYGIRIDRRGKTYLVIKSTLWTVFKVKVIALMHNLTHLRDKIRLRVKRHKGDYI